MVSPQNTFTPKRKRGFMMKSYQIKCPKCNNFHNFYRYGKTPEGYQTYQCKECYHQFAPDKPVKVHSHKKNYPSCPCCGKTTFLHHDYDFYSNYRCSNKKCNHSLFVPKPTMISSPSMSKLFGKTDFKRMRYR